MGYAIAKAAEYRGARVILVSGPTALAPPHNVEHIAVESVDQMADAVFARMDEAQIIIKSAAVGDYGVKTRSAQKIKKSNTEMVLELAKTTDILKTLGGRKGDRFLVGFAAETEKLSDHAGEKLAKKNLDMIVGNLVGVPDGGFQADTNTVTLFFKDGSNEPLPNMGKDEVARILLDRIKSRMGF
jgi:phosphopantothenoylcysteine decarboxylase/phosphopantothenate--cysteine ligase